MRDDFRNNNEGIENMKLEPRKHQNDSVLPWPLLKEPKEFQLVFREMYNRMLSRIIHHKEH